MPTTGAAGDYLERLIMRWIGRNTSMPTPPSTLYLALFTGGVPSDDGSGATECNTGNYARLALSTGTSETGIGSVFEDPPPTTGAIVNSADVVFPTCTGVDWGEVTGWALFDAPSGGNLLIRGDMTPTAEILIGDAFRFLAADWTIFMS